MANILVVDDEPAIRECLAAALQARNHVVVEAVSGQTARQALKRSRFDVVLLDLIMSDGDGFEVISKIKAKPGRPRIIALSGKGNPVSDYLQCALACGADLALAKSEQKLSVLIGIVETLAAADATTARDLQIRMRPVKMPLVWPLSLLRPAMS